MRGSLPPYDSSRNRKETCVRSSFLKKVENKCNIPTGCFTFISSEHWLGTSVSVSFVVDRYGTKLRHIR